MAHAVCKTDTIWWEICSDSSGPVKFGHKNGKKCYYSLLRNLEEFVWSGRRLMILRFPKTHDFLRESGWKDLVSTVK